MSHRLRHFTQGGFKLREYCLRFKNYPSNSTHLGLRYLVVSEVRILQKPEGGEYNDNGDLYEPATALTSKFLRSQIKSVYKTLRDLVYNVNYEQYNLASVKW